MKTLKTILPIVLLLAIQSCGLCKHQNLPETSDEAVKKAEEYDVNAVASAIQKQYVCALNSLEKEKITNIEITNAELSLTVIKSTTGSGELSVLIFSGSGSLERESSTSMTFTLSKADTLRTELIENSDDQLCELIVATAKKFHELKGIGDLKKESFELEITFSIKVSVEGKITFEIWKIGGEGAVGKEKTVEHGITLTFKEKSE